MGRWRRTGTDRHFPDAILLRNDIALWGRRGTRGYDAGVIANLSEDCVGMSNCFGTEAMASAARLCLSFGGGLPLVGYERGDDLREALEAGMITTGPLRIWHRV